MNISVCIYIYIYIYQIMVWFLYCQERDQPHAVSFLRTLSGATSVTYQAGDMLIY